MKGIRLMAFSLALVMSMPAMMSQTTVVTPCGEDMAHSDQLLALAAGKKSKAKSKGKTTGSTGNTTPAPAKAPAPTLEVDRREIEYPSSGSTIWVNVSTNQNDWDVEIENAYGSESFVNVTKDGSSLGIMVPENLSSGPRTQNVTVTAGALSRTIIVKQEANPIHIAIIKGDNAYFIKSKGEEKKVTVACDSPITYSSNSNLNWYVSEKPAWVQVSLVEDKKGNKPLDKIKNWALDGVNTVINMFKTPDGKLPDGFTASEVKIKVLKNTDSLNRQGTVTFSSGGSSVSIQITQEGK